MVIEIDIDANRGLSFSCKPNYGMTAFAGKKPATPAELIVIAAAIDGITGAESRDEHSLERRVKVELRKIGKQVQAKVEGAVSDSAKHLALAQQIREVAPDV